MPENDIEIVTKEWLQSELRSSSGKDLIILDCRSSNEYIEGHIRSAVNFSIPSIMLRRLAAGKIDLLSTIKSRELKERIQSGYKINLFVLYNENSNFMMMGDNNCGSSNNLITSSSTSSSETTVAGTTLVNNSIISNNSGGSGILGDSGGGGGVCGVGDCCISDSGGIISDDSGNDDSNNKMDFVDDDDDNHNQHQQQMQQHQHQHNFGLTLTNFNNSSMNIGGLGSVIGCGGSNSGSNNDPTNTTTINVLHRRLKQDGCRVVCLQGGYSNFRDAFPEWCEEDTQNHEMESSRGIITQADQLMGLRSLRISTPHSDSACSSSAESSDCESTSHHHHHHHHYHHHNYQLNEAPVEIVPGLFLGNASHSEDSGALQKYNIKYVLNVTPDLPNHFEASGCGIQYLQIPITDHYSQDLAVHFPAAIRFIEEAQSKGSAVLVHCLAGVSRSVTVTLAYLMHTKSLCLNDAFSLVRDRKPDVAPNFHFMEQLHSFERQLKLSHHDNHDHHQHLPNNCNTLTGTTSTTTCGLLSSLSSVSSSTSSSSSSTTSSSGTTIISQRDCERCTKYVNTYTNNFVNNDECKCMQTDFLARVKTTGVSPDSGIEFDRWTPSSDGGGSSSGSGILK